MDFVKDHPAISACTATLLAINIAKIKEMPISSAIPLSCWSAVNGIVLGSIVESQEGWRQAIPLALLNMLIGADVRYGDNTDETPAEKKLMNLQAVITVNNLISFIATRII